MDADTREQPRIFLRQPHDRLRRLHRIPEIDDAGYARSLRARHRLRTVLIELPIVQVGMRVDKLHHRTIAPMGISTESTFSSSPADAARTMPWDTMPRIFAGFRLMTMTTFLPISSSGS